MEEEYSAYVIHFHWTSYISNDEWIQEIYDVVCCKVETVVVNKSYASCIPYSNPLTLLAKIIAANQWTISEHVCRANLIFEWSDWTSSIGKVSKKAIYPTPAVLAALCASVWHRALTLLGAHHTKASESTTQFTLNKPTHPCHVYFKTPNVNKYWTLCI